MTSRQNRQDRQHREQGSATLETVIVFPTVILLVWGLMGATSAKPPPNKPPPPAPPTRPPPPTPNKLALTSPDQPDEA